MTDLVETARERAEELLLRNGTALGLVAAGDAYQQVWARDSMVCGFGLMLTVDPTGQQVHRSSIDTLARFTTPLGNIPHSVGLPGVRDPALVAHGGALGADEALAGGVVVDTVHSGCIDSSLWFILSCYYAHLLAPDGERLAGLWKTLTGAHLWLRYQDSNECGLLEVHEAMDWADLYANRYNSLGANVLWYGAHRAMAGMAEAVGEDPAPYAAAADDVRYKLNTLLWVGPEFVRDLDWVRRNRREWLYPIQVTTATLQERPYYLPYVGFRDWADRFDTFGNLLAILLGVADAAQTARILDFIDAAGVAQPWPIKSVTPPVYPGEPDWREYYRLRNLNMPQQYHNGGAWPFLGGFFVAALVKAGRRDRAAAELERLAEMNAQGRDGRCWEFCEWFHGQSGRPMGFAHQSWSAGMYLYAYEAVRNGRCPVFSDDAWTAPPLWQGV